MEVSPYEGEYASRGEERRGGDPFIALADPRWRCKASVQSVLAVYTSLFEARRQAVCKLKGQEQRHMYSLVETISVVRAASSAHHIQL